MQASQHILLVRPAAFAYNHETAVSNTFQQKINLDEATIQQEAVAEFDAFVRTLRQKGINVLVIHDTAFPPKPDAIFPNNWASYHHDGTILLYPMCTPNRRLEKRPEIIDTIRDHFLVNSIIDLSGYESEERFLEGTGSIIFDHVNKMAYACLSPRTDKGLFEIVAEQLGYQPISFYARGTNRKEIYHTNVMMCIAEKLAIVCLESINDKEERQVVLHRLTDTGHEVIPISFQQMRNFAGNMLALKTNTNQDLMAMSQSAFDSLTGEQKVIIEKYCEIVPLPIPTIETIGGGSARCMIAEIFLPPLATSIQ